MLDGAKKKPSFSMLNDLKPPNARFSGSEGKQAAHVIKRSEGISTNDDMMPRLSWRGDGNYFVCSFINLEQCKFSSRGYSSEQPVVYCKYTIEKAYYNPKVSLLQILNILCIGDLLGTSSRQLRNYPIAMISYFLNEMVSDTASLHCEIPMSVWWSFYGILTPLHSVSGLNIWTRMSLVRF